MNFKKNYLILVIGLWAVVSCSGPKHSTAEQQNDTSSILWKISGKNLSSPSYLFGTVHIICSDKFFWTTAMQHAFDSCEQVAEEVDMSDTSTVMAMRKGLLLPTGKQLQDFFSPEDYKNILAFAKDSLGMKKAAIVLPRLTPRATVLTFSIKAWIRQCGKIVGYDTKILDWAKKAGKKVVGLETATDQLKAINSIISQDSSVKQLLRMTHYPGNVENQYPGNVKEHYQKLQSAYMDQDIEESNRILVSTMSEKSLNTIVYNRNEKWIDSIESLIHQRPTFIAVGAGHLGGKKGVVNLLKKEGYTLQPVH